MPRSGTAALATAVEAGGALAAVAALALALAAAPAWAGAGSPRATAGGAARPAPRALVVFYDAEGDRPPAVPGLSLGLVSAAEQSGYQRTRFLLDLTQGARVGGPAYPAAGFPPLRPTGTRLAGWPAVRRRAEDAAGRLEPGLLAASIPGGAAYAGPALGADGRAGDAATAGRGATFPSGTGPLPPAQLDALVAAGREGRIARVSLGGPGDLLARIAQLQRASALVIADLPAGAAGRADLARLVRGRRAGELLVALQRADRGGELLWAGIAGLREHGAGPGELESASTEQRGLVSAVDIAPTLLDHLGVPVPGAMEGRAIAVHGSLDRGALRALGARLRAIPGRRLPALGLLLAACGLLVLACAARANARASALRTGALALLWAPVAALLPAALEPGPAGEYALIVGVALALAVATDRALPWPRALAAPALAAPLAIAVDALARTQLQMRSLAGPDPIGGARFYGIGNELKSALAATALVGLGAALHPLEDSGRRRAGLATAGAGLLLVVIEGWARIGAGVGGAALVAAAFGLAAAMLLAPAAGARRVRRRRWIVALASVPAGLALLVAIDLATARGHGHLQGSVLQARSFADVRDELANRYATAWRALRGAGMALATAAAVAVAAAAAHRRQWLLRPVGGDALFAAAFAGGLLGGVVGALIEDSGPLLLVEAVVALATAGVYLHSPPPLPAAGPAGPIGNAYASSSEAPSPTAERPTIAVLGGSQGSA